MSKTTKILIIVGVALALGTLLYFLLPGDDNEEDKKELPEDKKEIKDQKRNSEGGYLLYQLLKEYKNTVSLKTIQDPLKNTLESYKTDYPTVYFLLDREISVSQEDMDTLYNFVKTGNSAFIATKELNSKFYNYFFYNQPISYFRDTVHKLNFYHDDLKLRKHYPLKIKRKSKVKKHRWNYIEVEESFYTELAIISTDKKYERPIFIKFKVGDGWIYLHSVPEAFYNASMFTEEGLEYAESVFSNLPKGHYLWHEHSKKWDPFKDYKKNNRNNNNKRSIENDSPLKYILNNRALTWAYLTLLISLLLYIIFKTKRKQRVIPAIEPNNNNSLEFINTVSKLYLRQNKHHKFIKHYELSFIHFIRDKYYINSSQIDDSFINQVSLKSEIEVEKIEEIFNDMRVAKSSSNFAAEALINLHKKIEYFYKNCK